MVYGLCDANGSIFYVGRTKNPKRRFANYQTPCSCHNKALSEHINTIGGALVKILELNPKNINDAEIFWIDRMGNNTFNLVGKPYQAWVAYKSKPWQAGTGVRCPSDYFMWLATKLQGEKAGGSFDKLLDIREDMSIMERCSFEVNVYRGSRAEHKKDMKVWFSRCSSKLLLELCNG